MRRNTKIRNKDIKREWRRTKDWIEHKFGRRNDKQENKKKEWHRMKEDRVEKESWEWINGERKDGEEKG